MMSQAIDAKATASGSTDDHEWHSADYVKEWVEKFEEKATASDRATRQSEFEMLASSIPFADDAPLKILDVGAGWGPLSLHLLESYSCSSVTLLDYSEPMLEEARRRLSGYEARATFQQADLSEPGSVSKAAGPFHVIVSASTIHNLPLERVPALYRELRDALVPGGSFLNLDYVAPPFDTTLLIYGRVIVDGLRKRWLEQEGKPLTFDEALARLQQSTSSSPSNGDNHFPELLASLLEWRKSGGISSMLGVDFGRHNTGIDFDLGGTIVDNLRWLHEAGFGVDFWRQGHRMLMAGYLKPE